MLEAEKEAGVRAGRSAIDHIYTIAQVIDKQTANDQELAYCLSLYRRPLTMFH